MSPTDTGIDVGSLPRQIGDNAGGCSSVRCGECRDSRTELWPPPRRSLAGSAWSIALLVLSLAGLSGTTIALRQLRRAGRVHADEADYQQLAASSRDRGPQLLERRRSLRTIRSGVDPAGQTGRLVAGHERIGPVDQHRG